MPLAVGWLDKEQYHPATNKAKRKWRVVAVVVHCQLCGSQLVVKANVVRTGLS